MYNYDFARIEELETLLTTAETTVETMAETTTETTVETTAEVVTMAETMTEVTTMVATSVDSAELVEYYKESITLQSVEVFLLSAVLGILAICSLLERMK